MLNFSFGELGIIGIVALVVLGPERLPKVARTAGHLFGKAQRYVADVKAEVNRSIELEELRKMKTQVEEAARDVQSTVQNEWQSASDGLNQQWNEVNSALGTPVGSSDAYPEPEPWAPLSEPPTRSGKRKNWRLKRSAMPQWYKQRHGVRSKALSGAARVARYRPKRTG